MPPEFARDEENNLSPIVLADRGKCSFVNKVRNIEKLGVKVAFICDNKPE